MTAWTKGLLNAPRTKQVLVRLQDWDCPSVMRFEQFEDGEQVWIFVEQTLSDIAGGLEPEEEALAEWALIPD